MILNPFQSTKEKKRKKRKKEYIYRNQQRETTPPSAFSRPFFLFSTINIRNIGKKERKKRGKEKKLAPLLESHVILPLWYLINE